MNRLKRNCPYVIGLIVSIVCLLCAFIPIFWLNGTSYGYNLYINLSLSSLGFWHILLCIFEVMFFITIIAIFVICFLEILKDAKLVEFKITLGKITSLLVLKFCLFTLLTLSATMLLLTWFMILANKDYGIVFGAGPFVLLAVLLVAVVLFVFLERADYFKNWAEVTDTKKEKEEKTQDIVVEETFIDEQNKEDEIVIDPEKKDK